jgi:hypothetical protein
VQGKALDGQIITAHAAMLSLPSGATAAYEALPADEAMERRLQEVEFAKSSLELSRLVNAGNVTAARTLVKDLEKRFGQHPWLQAKLARLRELAERDPEMMSKEARFQLAQDVQTACGQLRSCVLGGRNQYGDACVSAQEVGRGEGAQRAGQDYSLILVIGASIKVMHLFQGRMSLPWLAIQTIQASPAGIQAESEE